jgi:hypothetical protein
MRADYVIVGQALLDVRWLTGLLGGQAGVGD